VNYNWFEFTGWLQMLYLHILPYWVVLTYIYTLIITKVILVACRVPKESYSFFSVSSWVALISTCTFLLECVICHIFTVLMHFNDHRYYVQGGVGYSIYENVTYFSFTLINVCFCAYICYRLNMRFTLQHIVLTGGNRERAILLISILTAPFIFLVPIVEIVHSSITW